MMVGTVLDGTAAARMHGIVLAVLPVLCVFALHLGLLRYCPCMDFVCRLTGTRVRT